MLRTLVAAGLLAAFFLTLTGCPDGGKTATPTATISLPPPPVPAGGGAPGGNKAPGPGNSAQ